MKIILFAILLLLSTRVSSQEVIATQGKSHTNSISSIDYTIGEVVIATFSVSASSVTQGFHQTNLTVLDLEDFDIDDSIKVFPNPTSDILKLDVLNFQNLRFFLYDMHGRQVYKDLITSKSTNVSMESLNQGVYILTILSENNKKLKTYKIIKN